MRGEALAELRRRAETAPTRHIPWLPVQQAFLDDPARQKLIRTGNQFWGKTTALCEEIHRLAEGRHPDPHMQGRPLELIAIDISYKQQLDFQRKVYDSADKNALQPSVEFTHARGFKGREPLCEWRNGSILRFRSGDAGPRAIAGATVDAVIINEPTSFEIYREATRRVVVNGGYIIMGMTPINAPAPLDWLQKLVTDGVVSEHHTTLTPESLIPIGHTMPRRTKDGRLMDAGFIAEQRRTLHPHIAAIVLDGGWETPPDGQAFPVFDPRPGGKHVVNVSPPGEGWRYLIGIDHGERDHKQTACLVAYRLAGTHPEVWILDEYAGEGLTTPEEDAAGILSMLARWSLRWPELHEVRGDKPHDVRSVVRSVSRKSNADLTVAIARRLNLHPGSLRPKIYQAKTGGGGGRGSVLRGVRWLHTIMLRDGMFHIDERCQRMIRALSRWSWSDDEYKDPIDSLRYALWSQTQRTQRITSDGPALIIR